MICLTTITFKHVYNWHVWSPSSCIRFRSITYSITCNSLNNIITNSLKGNFTSCHMFNFNSISTHTDFFFFSHDKVWRHYMENGTSCSYNLFCSLLLFFLYGTEMFPQLMKLILRSEMLHYICFFLMPPHRSQSWILTGPFSKRR